MRKPRNHIPEPSRAAFYFNMARSVICVLVDLTHLHPNGLSGGIKPALLEMLRWLGTCRAPEVQFVYVVNARSTGDVESILRPGDRTVLATDAPRDLAARELCDVVYCPFGSTSLACPGIPTVTLIVDLLHRDYPASISLGERILREQWFAEALTRTDLFQVISDYTAERLAHHYAIARHRMVRTYLPIHHRLLDTRAVGPRLRAKEFLFYPANAWIHKNHESLLEAYALYRTTAGSEAWELVLTGAANERMTAVRAFAAKLGLESKVHFAGYVSDDNMVRLWREAGALVFPSLHEGFGIPLLEAMAHGLPILASNATAIPEVVGEAALLVDASQIDELAAGITRIIDDSNLRRSLVARGHDRLRKFAPDREFGLLHQALRAAIGSDTVLRRVGYYEEDGLTDPHAVFALPSSLSPGTVQAKIRALPAYRMVEFWCGPDQVHEIGIPAGTESETTFSFVPRTPTLTIRIPNANRLHETDPRTHGILLDGLSWEIPDGKVDLLQDASILCQNSPEAE